MRRTPWMAVFWTVLVLVSTTLSTYLPWRSIAPPAIATASRVWTQASGRARAWIDERMFVLALQQSRRSSAARSRGVLARLGAAALPGAGFASSVPVLGLALGAGLALSVALVRRARRRRHRPRVLRLAGQGEDLHEIARRTGLSQDAVRLLLSPMFDSSRGGRGGSSFRKGAAVTAAGATTRPRRVATT